MADPNTRQGKRTPVTLKIKFKSETLEQFIERYAVDVSQGGIFIRTKEPLAVGTQMRFEFQLRDASPLIGGEGTVVWTRENDPSRPAIAPGMGVRFDRLAEGSQSVLERILAEKAKQAPQRPPDTAKPPLFTDTPTRVAPPPVQEALLGNESKRNKRGSDAAFNDQHTPLPKPMPFHSDADEFPEEAFEEATKVRALDELIAQTAEGNVGSSTEPDLFPDRANRPAGLGAAGAVGKATGLDELAARRAPARADSTLADPPAPAAPVPDASSTSPGFASGAVRASDKTIDRDSAPGLPSPPSAPTARPGDWGGAADPAKPAPRLLDTSPSPRTQTDEAMEKLAKTKLGMEPVAAMVARSATPLPGSQPAMAQSVKDAMRPSGQHAVGPAVHEPTSSMRMPAKKSSAVPILILILVLVAASGAGVWFFVLREKAAEENVVKKPPPPPAGSGSEQIGSGSQVVAEGSGSGSQAAVTPGSNAEAPKGPMMDFEVTSTVPKAQVEIVGGESGPAPLKTKLEKDKAYKVRVSAPGFATFEKDVKGGTDSKLAATLDPKPRSIDVATEPAGALIYIDGAPTGHSTPSSIDLTKVQAAKKTVRIGLRKAGYRPIDKVVDAGAYTESPDKLLASVNEKLVVQQVVIRPPPGTGSGSGSGSGSAGTGAGSGETNDGSGGTSPGSNTPPPPPPPTGGGSGSNEPTPGFVNP